MSSLRIALGTALLAALVSSACAGNKPVPSSGKATAPAEEQPLATGTEAAKSDEAAAATSAPGASGGSEAQGTGAAVEPPLMIELSPGTVRQGDAAMLTVQSRAGDTAWKTPEDCPDLLFGDRPVQFFVLSDSSCRAFLALPVEQPPGRVPVRAATSTEVSEAEGLQQILGELEVVEAKFNVRELTVAKKFVSPPASVMKKMKADRQAFKRAYAQPFGPPLFDENFVWPMTTPVTAPFGDLRTFNGKKESQHYGTDLNGNIGDPIAASNDGKVVMARENYAAGNTVLLHHGADLYTAYFHLSKIEVKQGQKVKQGQRLGLVGKTGRVTGPHLHFSVRVGGMYVDPASLLKLDLTRKP